MLGFAEHPQIGGTFFCQELFAISNSDMAETLSPAEQLRHLRSRGMIIKDESAALSCLEHVPYFRLSRYWRIFANADKQFRPGTSFEQVLAIYRFDQELRELVFGAIALIEVSLRTNFAHVLVCRHGPDAHLQANLFFDRSKWQKDCQKIERQIEWSLRQDRASAESPSQISAQSPIWEISEIISFGLLSMMYKNLNMPLRKEIARKYELESKVFVAWLHNLTQLRNSCSHHRRIWNHGFAAIAGQPRKISFKKEWNPKSTRIYNSLLAIDYLLGKLPFQQDWYRRLEQLLKKLPEGYPQKHMGFPANEKQ